MLTKPLYSFYLTEFYYQLFSVSKTSNVAVNKNTKSTNARIIMHLHTANHESHCSTGDRLQALNTLAVMCLQSSSVFITHFPGTQVEMQMMLKLYTVDHNTHWHRYVKVCRKALFLPFIILTFPLFSPFSPRSSPGHQPCTWISSCSQEPCMCSQSPQVGEKTRVNTTRGSRNGWFRIKKTLQWSVTVTDV